MRKLAKLILGITVAATLVFPSTALAREGDSGYEGGISSGEVPEKTSFDYQEVCFITGEPVVLKGTLTLKKSVKQDSISATYTYNLKNTDLAATFTRVVAFNTKLTKKDNGQTIEETNLTGKPSEVFKINNVSYTLRNYEYTRTNIIDKRPAINYYAGNTWGKKTYQKNSGQTGTSSSSNGGGTVTVETTGSFYGYDQYWGTAEAIILDHIIQSEEKKQDVIEKWGGTARVSLSSTTTKKLRFVENEPSAISFNGGYVQTQYNDSILEYSARLPEFDSSGISTDNIITTNDSLSLLSSPVQLRLAVPNLRHLRGHWAEDDIKILYSLEVLKGDDTRYDPEQYMTRAEFAAAVDSAAREVPADPALAGKTASRTTSMAATRTGRTKQKIESSFSDVPVEDKYFPQINNAYKRGLIMGTGYDSFGPDENLTVADAVTILIRAIGLEGLAPAPNAVTGFRDNDDIPDYARNAAYVAERIGLAKGDDMGYLNPQSSMTKAYASSLLRRFIDYMREDIRKDYRERIVSY